MCTDVVFDCYYFYWLFMHYLIFFFFFFQAEDGIRDKLVTGVQTCALPISCPRYRTARPGPQRFHAATLEPDWLHARTVFSFLKEENTKCQNKTKLSSVVLLKRFGTRAICRW